MLDIASILEKSQDPSFVRFRECRDSLLNKGKEAGIAEGKKEGIAEGIAKGKAEGIAQGIVKILVKRFGDIPDQLKNQIHNIKDIAILDQLLDLCLSINSLDEFHISGEGKK